VKDLNLKAGEKGTERSSAPESTGSLNRRYVYDGRVTRRPQRRERGAAGQENTLEIHVHYTIPSGRSVIFKFRNDVDASHVDQTVDLDCTRSGTWGGYRCVVSERGP
jgi:hypothetical protein